MGTRNRAQDISGVIPVMPIPFDADERIDEESLRRLVDFAVTCKVEAICLPAYGSEFYKLTEDERMRVVKIAIEQSAGRVLVVAQCNHGSARVASSFARSYAEAGADVVSVAIPRQFSLPDDDIAHYLGAIMKAADVPCLIQDFNPGGPTVSAEFVARLKGECSNFRYLKLEEPLMVRKLLAIREATKDGVRVLEGWGGLYTMELIPAGIGGLMPGLGLADVHRRVFKLRTENQSDEAFRIYGRILPQLVFSLQNMEMFMYCEKRLLEARGLLSNARSRSACYTPDLYSVRYVDELNERILQLIDEIHPKA